MSQFLRRALAAVSVVCVATWAAACSKVAAEPIVVERGAVGDPCVLMDENRPNFSSFAIGEDVIGEDYDDQCLSGLCLVNHFQGRATCPLGQEAPAPCGGPLDASCGPDSACTEAGAMAVYCDPASADGGASACAGYGDVCNAQRSACECGEDAHCPTGSVCDTASKECKRYVCHAPGSCQSQDATDAENAGKDCCVPGTDTPISVAVCGQCDAASKRDAENAVYCSCRCGPAEGAPEEPGAEFCTCPGGFECTEIRRWVGLGDPSLVGKYCIKAGTDYDSHQACGSVVGNATPPQCEGSSP